MNFPLIGLHAWLGEFAALMFAWAFVELLSSTDANIRRARLATLLGVVFIGSAWLAGGFYYVEVYGTAVKPLIKEGPMPWVHSIVMETKEHVFIFLPFLGLLAYGLLQRTGDAMPENPVARTAAKYALGSLALMTGGMALLGFLVSSGFRAALEQLVT
ncbi:hypothetical protein ACFL07_08540 [Pseudomonadota bacterium]